LLKQENNELKRTPAAWVRIEFVRVRC